jgi:hypothetical protein
MIRGKTPSWILKVRFHRPVALDLPEGLLEVQSQFLHLKKISGDFDAHYSLKLCCTESSKTIDGLLA